MSTIRDLIVIGGGAAGLWAAGTAAQRCLHVTVLEKNRKAGVKILMSGGTRCNLTHACDIAGIMDAFGKQGRFLKPALYELPPSEVVASFNRLGVATKVEETGKVFPVSDRAIDVRDALVSRLTAAGAELRTGVAVRDLSRLQDGTFQVQLDDGELQARNILLCSGGKSYPGCGTTGDGYAWVERLGHTVTPTRPSLTPLLSTATWGHALSGLTLPDVIGHLRAAERGPQDPRRTSRGGFLWTHFGCSGPVPMNVSKFVDENAARDTALLELDLVPTVSPSELANCFATSLDGRRQVASILHQWLPRRLAQTLLERAEVAADLRLAELRKASRVRLLTDLKRLEVPLSGNQGYPKAEVTAGGVALAEVNPKTLQSRLVPGLFLAGEIMDFDGPIGGYNFQAAFSTGHLAALRIE